MRTAKQLGLQKELFGEKEGQPVYQFTMRNHSGLSVSCINYGCIITDIRMPDRDGREESIVLGFDSLANYEHHADAYFGAAVGRVAGRISRGSFRLGGKTVQLAQNEKGNHLHGGMTGFSQVLWHADTIESKHAVTVQFSYSSPDGEEGYPGNVHMKIEYTLTADNELQMCYEGTADQDTLLNVTNHSYFNLSGEGKRDVLDHELTVSSRRFLELDAACLPTGSVLDVQGTAFDFRKGRKIREGVTSAHLQNRLAGGYDHPLLLDDPIIRLKDPESGRQMIMETDAPCLVLYSGNKLAGRYTIRGKKARNHMGLCLETQAAPDFIHHPHLPGSVLRAGELYRTSTNLRFSAE